MIEHGSTKPVYKVSDAWHVLAICLGFGLGTVAMTFSAVYYWGPMAALKFVFIPQCLCALVLLPLHKMFNVKLTPPYHSLAATYFFEFIFDFFIFSVASAFLIGCILSVVADALKARFGHNADPK